MRIKTLSKVHVTNTFAKEKDWMVESMIYISSIISTSLYGQEIHPLVRILQQGHVIVGKYANTKNIMQTHMYEHLWWI